MKTATVRDLRNRDTGLMRWIGAGEEIVITRRGKPIMRLVPEGEAPGREVDWSESPAVKRDRSGSRMLTVEESADVLHEAGGEGPESLCG